MQNVQSALDGVSHVNGQCCFDWIRLRKQTSAFQFIKRQLNIMKNFYRLLFNDTLHIEVFSVQDDELSRNVSSIISQGGMQVIWCNNMQL